MSLRQGPIYTTATRPSVGQINRYDATAGALATTLPALEDSAVGTPMMLQKIDSSVNTVSFTAATGDAFDNATTLRPLSSKGSAYVLQVVSLSGVKSWKVMDFLPGVDALAAQPGAADVKALGAVGNGVANDTTICQAAITACAAAGGGIVYFPPGTYLVSSLTIPSKVTLMGAGRGATVIKKSANGTLLDASGSATGFATHVTNIRITNLTCDGDGKTGALLRTYYADNVAVDNARLINNDGRCVDAVELWDSRFDFVHFESLSTTLPAVHLRCTAAASGFGSGTDNTNNIRFLHCRWEWFKFGALHMEEGGFGSSLVHSIHVTDCKMESGTIRGIPVLANAGTECIHIKGLFLWGGAFASGFSTAQTAIYFTPVQHSSLRDVYIGCSTDQVWNLGVEVYTANGPLVIDNLMYRGGALPAGSLIWFAGGSTGLMEVGSVNATAGTILFGGAPNVEGPRPLKTVSASSASTLTPNPSTTVKYSYTALAAGLTINAPNSWEYAIVDGQELEFRFKDNGTSRALTWNAIYRAVGVTLPTATVVNKTVYVRGRWNMADSKVDMIDVKQEV